MILKFLMKKGKQYLKSPCKSYISRGGLDLCRTIRNVATACFFG